MKKLICILLMLLFCFNFSNITTFAANEKIVVKAVPSTAKLSRDEIFAVDFNLTSNSGFVTLGLEISYNANVLEIYCPNHVDGKNCLSSRSPVSNMYRPQGLTNNATNSRYHTSSPYKIMWAFSNSTEDVYYTGIIATLTFKVKKNAVLGSTDITVNIDQCTSENLGSYRPANRTGVSATVDISCVNHKYSDWARTKAPTCTKAGEETRACTECKKAETREIKALEHKFGEWKITKDSTCINEGAKVRKCTNSGCTYTENQKIPLKSHTMGEWSIVKEASCIQTGVLKSQCTVCKKEEVNELAKTEHKLKEAVITLEATCTKDGKMEGECTVCGKKNSEEKIPATGHSFGEAVVTKEPTDTETGIKTSTCTVCGEKKEEVIPSKNPSVTCSEVEMSTESKDDTITVITNDAASEKFMIILLAALIVVGISAMVISIIKIKKLK